MVKYIILGLVVLIGTLGVMLKFERDDGKELTVQNTQLSEANDILTMKVVALENSRYIDSMVQKDLDEKNTETRNTQNDILEKVTQDVQKIQQESPPTSESETGETDRISRIAIRVSDGMWESYCEAVPTDVDCAKRRAAEELQSDSETDDTTSIDGTGQGVPNAVSGTTGRRALSGYLNLQQPVGIDASLESGTVESARAA